MMAERLTRREIDGDLPYLETVDTYSGLSERIKGLQRIAEAVGVDPIVDYVNPIIVRENVYDEYKKNGQSEDLKNIANQIWLALEGQTHPLIVRRLFHDFDGRDKPGPRSRKIRDFDSLIREIVNIYQAFDEKYSDNEVIPQIMVHPIIDAGDPPMEKSPALPFPGGAITAVDENLFYISATFGADESIRNFPTDKWKVEFNEDGSFTVIQTLTSKDSSCVAADPSNDTYTITDESGDFNSIAIPQQFREIPSLTTTQIMALAEVCRRLTQKFGPYRLEFDGTIAANQHKLYIVEADFNPSFEIPDSFREYVARGKTLTIHTFSRQLIKKIKPNGVYLVHIPRKYLGREKTDQDLLTSLATTARGQNTLLAIFAGTDISTQHAVRMFQDAGHAVFKTEDRRFSENEEITFYTEDNRLLWERKIPILRPHLLGGESKEEIGGKALGLRKLEEQGFLTAPYFVIGTSLFRRIVKELELEDEIKSLDDCAAEKIAAISQTIIQKIRNYQGDQLSAINDEIEKELDLIGGDTFFVRSSATCEDSRISFAGAFDTEPKVKRKNIKTKILQVLASTFNTRAIRFARMLNRMLNLKPSEMKMAIIVQRAVIAEKAGTIFTADHLNRDRKHLTIEAAKGPGENIVAGTSEASQNISIDKSNLEISSQSHRDGPVLTEEEAKMLAELGVRIEKSLKDGPQDIEWAIDKNGHVYILQSRRLSLG